MTNEQVELIKPDSRGTNSLNLCDARAAGWKFSARRLAGSVPSLLATVEATADLGGTT